MTYLYILSLYWPAIFPFLLQFISTDWLGFLSFLLHMLQCHLFIRSLFFICLSVTSLFALWSSSASVSPLYSLPVSKMPQCHLFIRSLIFICLGVTSLFAPCFSYASVSPLHSLPVRFSPCMCLLLAPHNQGTGLSLQCGSKFPATGHQKCHTKR